jgi:O-methyltransferase involved in polyketide biosynthesis
VTRSDADSWDPASSVSATATMVAAARALASREPEPLIVDPFAANLVRAVGIGFLDGGAAMGERAKTMGDHWREHGFDVDLSELFYPGERSHVVKYLSGHGWTVSARNRPEVFADYGRHYPNIEALSPLRISLAVIATRK